ncbi:MAG: Hsp33 family molecular chaperone HslO [Firmicutes bacterium]|nr:Hsp33 family molecular chaperone HslO [Bacillota bacterium]
MKDHLIIATSGNGHVRIYAAFTAATVETARKIHDVWPTAIAALGRVLTATLITGVMSDNPYRLTVQIKGDGPLGMILAVSNRRGEVKGYLENPHVDLDLNPSGKLDVGAAIGSGTLTVIKDYGLKSPYYGVVPLQNGEVAMDFAYYFTKSEQTPSAVSLGVLVEPDGSVKIAGGLIIQIMPGATEEQIRTLEEKLNELPPLTTMLKSGMTPTDLINEVTGAMGAKILEEVALSYRCDCSRERFLGPLLSLGQGELDGIINEQGLVEVRCHFCNKRYHYRESELKSEQG